MSEGRENLRNHVGRTCHLSDEETELHAGEATWQKLHMFIIGSQFTDF